MNDLENFERTASDANRFFESGINESTSLMMMMINDVFIQVQWVIQKCV